MTITTLAEKITQPLLDINAAWQESYESARRIARVAGNQSDRMILGIDIGGTGIRAAGYKAHNGVLDESDKALFTIEMPTPKGIGNLGEGYQNILVQAFGKAAEQGAVVTGIGIGSPGRPIPKSLFTEKYPDAAKQPAALSLRSKPYEPYTANADLPWAKNSGDYGHVLAPNSANNLSVRDGEFDGVALNSMLQRLSPEGMQVVVRNDAAAQLAGLVSALPAEEKAAKVDGKTVVYGGPGTGWGGAAMKNGQFITDGHYQYMKLAKRTGNADDTAVFDLIAGEFERKYRLLNNPGGVFTEDLCSGTGIAKVIYDSLSRSPDSAAWKKLEAALADNAAQPEGKRSSRTDVINKAFDTIFAENAPEMQPTLARLQSVGHYIGDSIAHIHKGDIEFMDRQAQWPKADIDATKGFDTFIFGGGLSKSPVFQKVIFPAAKQVLDEQNISIDFIFPKKAVAAAMHAAAATVSEDALKMATDQLQELNAQLAGRKTGIG